MAQAYRRIFDRFGLTYRAVAADSGAIGGDLSEEFQVIAATGEDAIVYCPGSDYAANMEKAEALAPQGPRPSASQAMTKTATPGKSTCAVAMFPANAFGLHDTLGNVQEWVNDWFDEYYYFDSPVDDPPGPKAGQLRVVRGGCYAMLPIDCRCAARRGHAPDSASETIGFRVIMDVG